MDSRYYYTQLTPADKEYLRIILSRRWKAVWKRLLMAGVLPMGVILLMLFIMNLVILANIDSEKNIKGINIPPGIEHFSLLWLSIPIFLILLAVNVFMFLNSIPPLYIDIKRNKKKQLVFTPAPYSIPGTGEYYINTGLPAMRFIKVTYEQYMNLDYSRPCFLEVTPLTNIPLGIKTIDIINA